MAYDDPKLPRAVLRGENLYVGDDKEPYFRDPGHTFDLIVTDLNLAGGFEPEDWGNSKGPKVPVSPGLRGRALIEGRTKFPVAGFDIGRNDKIEFHLRTAAEEETRFHWAARIGYTMYDLEMNAGNEFYVQGYCTPAEFERVVSAVRTGSVECLRVNMSTTMWTKTKSSFFPQPMVFHVAPPTDKESATPSTESGFIRSITWEESYGYQTPPPPDDDEPPKPAVIELPARAYSLLSALVGLLAALVVLTFLRH